MSGIITFSMENPFVITGKIPPEYFCDREVESRRLVSLITNGHNVLLVSPRRMGKTGLIYHCFDFPEIKDAYITIFVDILQTTSLQEFTFLLGKAVYDAVLPKGRKMISKFIEALRSLAGKFTFDVVTGAPAFSIQLGDIASPGYTLDEIFEFIDKTDIRCIVAIDEFQQIAMYPEKNVEAILRTHIQRSSNCNFIFSGSRQHILSEMFFYPSRPFYNSTSILHLDPIPEDVYAQFAGRLFLSGGKDIDNAEVANLYKKFGGTTFYLQSVLNKAFYLTPKGERCGKDTIDQALRDQIEAGGALYREILSALKIRQKELLVAIAKEEPARSITSGDFIARNRLLSPSSVQSAMKKLSDLNLLAKTEEGVSITDKFFAIWLRETY